MKKKCWINIILFLIVPLLGYSRIDTAAVSRDTLRADETYFLVPRSIIDRANADAEICDWFKEQLPNALILKDLYKKGYKVSLKLDTLQTAEIQQSDKIIFLTDENYQSVKKRLRKNKALAIWDNLNKPIILGIGLTLGIVGGKLL
jgi:hypothetical protein